MSEDTNKELLNTIVELTSRVAALEEAAAVDVSGLEARLAKNEEVAKKTAADLDHQIKTFNKHIKGLHS